MLEKKLAEKFKKISTATLTMQLLKRGIKSIWMYGPRPLGQYQKRIAGPAYTLRFIPGREDLNGPDILKRTDLAQRRAIEECPPGYVLVVDALGREDGASGRARRGQEVEAASEEKRRQGRAKATLPRTRLTAFLPN